MDALHAVDPDLVMRCAAGDADAADGLLSTLWVPAYRTALALCGGDPTVAQDVVQNACLTSLVKIGSLRDPRKFVPWFMRILARCATKELKTCARWCPLGEPQVGMSEGSEDDFSLLRLCVLELPRTLREPLILNAVIGYSSAEVATILRIPAGTVRFRVHRARQRLHEALEEHDRVAARHPARPTEGFARV
jgi:RNA polymerase sigma-70 factor, ECF subfamily